jgi:hypothetical protein
VNIFIKAVKAALNSYSRALKNKCSEEKSAASITLRHRMENILFESEQQIPGENQENSC